MSKQLTFACTLAGTAAALLAALPGPAYAAPGQLDPGFGTGGRVVVDLEPGKTELVDIAVQPDGKVVGVGHIANGKGSDVLVVRLNADGSPDASFGVRRLDLGVSDEADGVAVQPDGRILVAGWTSTNSDGIVWRLNPDGSTDDGFGTAGVVTLGGAGREFLTDVAPLADGRIVVAGASGDSNFSQSSMAVFRLSSAGAPDPSFDQDGVVVLPTQYGFSAVQTIDLQADGKLLVIGDDFAYNTMSVYRFTPEGALDPGFGSGGRASVPGTEPYAYSVRALPDGGVVAVGLDTSGEADVVLARFSAAGVLDPAYGGRLDLGSFDTLRDVDLDPAGRVVASGASGGDGLVVRFDPSGHLDASFGDHGVAEVPGSMPLGVRVVAQPDGKVLTVGEDGKTESRPLVARFLGDPPAPAAPATPTPTCEGKPATIVGTQGKDRLQGTRKADVIVALGGNDKIAGRGGDDLVCAGAGDDRIKGGDGKDVLRGEAGQDRLTGGGGKDRLVGGPGRDTVRP
jgi:uncharacterized delta-60 repeat protein